MSQRRTHIIRNACQDWPQHQQWQQDTVALRNENENVEGEEVTSGRETTTSGSKQAEEKRGLVEQG